MTLEALKSYCLAKKGAREDFPFDFDTLVIKVETKMFALISLTASPLTVNLKCAPFLAIDLRRKYSAVTPGYHMSKVHWNTVTIDGTVPDKEIYAMIDHSYELVYMRLTKAQKQAIE